MDRYQFWFRSVHHEIAYKVVWEEASRWGGGMVILTMEESTDELE